MKKVESPKGENKRNVVINIIGIILSLCVLILGVVGLTLALSSPRSGVSESNVNTVTSVKGIEFKVPNNWVLDEQGDYSQCTCYHNLSDFNGEGLNAISLTSSWVEKDFDIEGYATTFCDALQQSDSVASAELSSFTVSKYKVFNISMVNNGAFGGYIYLMKGNIIVEILYGTENVDMLEQYEDEVNDIIASMTFTGKAKESDFPEPEESSEASEGDSDVDEDSVESNEDDSEASKFDVSVDMGTDEDSKSDNSKSDDSSEASDSDKSDDSSKVSSNTSSQPADSSNGVSTSSQNESDQ